jgi:hypothetical protein
MSALSSISCSAPTTTNNVPLHNIATTSAIATADACPPQQLLQHAADACSPQQLLQHAADACSPQQ